MNSLLTEECADVIVRRTPLAASMQMKKCFKCDEVLPMAEFYPHPRMTDGHLGKCKKCTRYDTRQNRSARRAQYNAYDRERSKSPTRIAAIRASRATEKKLATQAVYNALQHGRLTREPCVVCGELKSEAHHTDYSKQLDVMWLCRRHHAALHRMP